MKERIHSNIWNVLKFMLLMVMDENMLMLNHCSADHEQDLVGVVWSVQTYLGQVTVGGCNDFRL